MKVYILIEIMHLDIASLLGFSRKRLSANTLHFSDFFILQDRIQQRAPIAKVTFVRSISKLVSLIQKDKRKINNKQLLKKLMLETTEIFGFGVLQTRDVNTNILSNN